MIRPTVRDKLLPDALRQGLLQSVLVFALSAARVGGIYAPWALAAAAVSGGKSRGLWALLGAGVGALVFFDFQTGLRFAASAVLIYSANMAFCDTKMYARKGFAPLLAALALLLVQSVYLVGRSAAQWALGVSASAVAAAVACGLDESRENGRLHLLVVMTAAAAALSAVQVEGFSPGSMTAAWLALLCAVGAPPANAAALGACAGMCADLAGETPDLLWAAVCASGALAASLLRRRPRVLQAAAFCLCAAAVPLALDVDRPWTVLYQAAVGAVAYALAPKKWLGILPDTAALPQAVPAMAAKTAAAERGENPAVIFDHAAQQTCRNCVLVKRCWQAEYNATYNAFNDACPAMLKRGRAEAEDFPLFFTSRCLHFPELLSAVNTELYAFRLRRQYRTRLEDARALAEAQYEHLGEVLGSETAPEPEGTLLRCRVGTLLRPKEGESACGDQLAVFTAGAMLYMLLSDGMGSGAEAHAESAMTVRLLRQFLKAGIQPASENPQHGADAALSGGRRLHHHRPAGAGSPYRSGHAVQIRRGGLLREAGRHGDAAGGRQSACRLAGYPPAAGGYRHPSGAGQRAGDGQRRRYQRGRRLAAGAAGLVAGRRQSGAGPADPGGFPPPRRPEGRLRGAGAAA